MTKDKNNNFCPLCGGRKKPGKTTYSVDLGEGILVVRNVKAKICAQCGEEWIDNKTAKELERITEEAREKRLQVEVVAL
ncbi:MAG: type II toxin-antitoxin system MqsA family antitoxin [Ignavibacteriae bacterium]|nr:type II toxin-antitoxin system MqsA family antitoxin [Ignavibacteriota bacterium]